MAIADGLQGYHPERQVGRTIVGKLTVSTVFTVDCGHETAILDVNGAYPVERYSNHKASVNGHKKWVKKAKKLKSVAMLSDADGILDEKVIQLKK